MFPPDETQRFAKELGVEQTVAAQLLEIERRKGVPERRAPSDEEIEQRGAETARQLRKEFGTDTDRVIQRMRGLIETRPGLAKALEVNGAGNSPGLVLPLARRAKALIEQEDKEARKAGAS